MTDGFAPASRASTRHHRSLDANRLATVLLGLLVGLLAVHAASVCVDFAVAIRSPLELDYGEGIVWQQAALIPGRQMYAPAASTSGLPFIVFHYPPVYYLLARAAHILQPNFLAAGRSVAAVSALMLVPLAASLVLLATPTLARGTRQAWMAALVSGLLVLCIEPVHWWGMLMRVDMPGLVFGLAGLAVAAKADGRFRGTVAALSLCTLAVFTKQTMMSFGIAVFLMALLQRPRSAILAALVVGAIGSCAVMLLQGATSGGFLQHIIGNNINRLAWWNAASVTLSLRDSLLLMLIAAGAGVSVIVTSLHEISARLILGRRHFIWQALQVLRSAEVVDRRRVLLALQFSLSTLMLVTLCKSGSATNYFLEWCCSAGVMVGVVLAKLPTQGGGWPLAPVCLIGGLLAGVLLLPSRFTGNWPQPAELARADAMVRRIAQAPLPVASENMVMLMQSGQGVVYEPSIVTELAYVGRWDEAPLVQTILRHGFAFMLTSDGNTSPTARRTPAVNTAMWEAYPNVVQIEDGLWLHER